MWMLEKRRGTGFKDREVSSPQPGEEPATPINIWERGELVNQAWCRGEGGARVSAQGQWSQICRVAQSQGDTESPSRRGAWRGVSCKAPLISPGPGQEAGVRLGDLG